MTHDPRGLGLVGGGAKKKNPDARLQATALGAVAQTLASVLRGDSAHVRVCVGGGEFTIKYLATF